MEPVVKQLINTKAACKMLGVSEKTLRKWCNNGFISYFMTAGGHKRYAVSELNEFLQKNYVKADS